MFKTLIIFIVMAIANECYSQTVMYDSAYRKKVDALCENLEYFRIERSTSRFIQFAGFGISGSSLLFRDEPKVVKNTLIVGSAFTLV